MDRRDDLLITWDGAGASHPLIGWLSSLNQASGRSVQYSIGFDVDEHVRAAANRRPDHWWQACLDNTTGEVADGLECVEITDLLHARLTTLKWPTTMRVSSSCAAANCSTTNSPPCSTPTATDTRRSSPTPRVRTERDLGAAR